MGYNMGKGKICRRLGALDYRKSYGLLTIGIWVGAAVVLLGLSLVTHSESVGAFIAIVGLLAMFAGIGQAFLFYKCPHCGGHIKIRGKKPNHCPNCGGKLDLL